MNKKLRLVVCALFSLAALVALGLFTGCQYPGGNSRDLVSPNPVVLTGAAGITVEDVVPVVTVAAEEGTFFILLEHPEWRPQFALAAADLKVIEKAERIDFPTIMAIVLRLPVKELKSTEARMAISGATILLSRYGGQGVPLDRLQQVRPIAAALREGIELGLSAEF